MQSRSWYKKLCWTKFCIYVLTSKMEYMTWRRVTDVCSQPYHLRKAALKISRALDLLCLQARALLLLVCLVNGIISSIADLESSIPIALGLPLASKTRRNLGTTSEYFTWLFPYNINNSFAKENNSFVKDDDCPAQIILAPQDSSIMIPQEGDCSGLTSSPKDPDHNLSFVWGEQKSDKGLQAV